MAQTTDEDFTLKLVGGGISIEKTVNKQVAMAIVAAVLNGVAATAPFERPETEERLQMQPAISLHEFLGGASNNATKIAAIGLYLYRYEGKETFSKDDLREAFRRAREAIPKNLPRDVGTAIKSNLIAEAPGKPGRYYVTHKGIDLVDIGIALPE